MSRRFWRKMKTSILNLDDLTVNSTKNFLIIEDEKDFNEYVVESLMLTGFNGEFNQAYCLKEAKNFLETKKIDFIICDWNLPDGEGFTLLKAIRKLRKFNDIPFLMMTANDDIDRMLKSSKFGGSEYLIKPFGTNELREKVIESWKHHLVKGEDYVQGLEMELKELKIKIETLEDENVRMKKLIQGLGK